MSDMNYKKPTITLGEKEYQLLFNINAIDEIQDRFDMPISQLFDLLKDERKLYKTLKFLIAVMINEAIDDEEKGGSHVTEQWVGRKLTHYNIGQLQDCIIKAMTTSSPESDDEPDPNVISE